MSRAPRWTGSSRLFGGLRLWTTGTTLCLALCHEEFWLDLLGISFSMAMVASSTWMDLIIAIIFRSYALGCMMCHHSVASTREKGHEKQS